MSPKHCIARHAAPRPSTFQPAFQKQTLIIFFLLFFLSEKYPGETGQGGIGGNAGANGLNGEPGADGVDGSQGKRRSHYTPRFF